MSPVLDPPQDHYENGLCDSNIQNLIVSGSSSEEEDGSGNEYGEYSPLSQDPDNGGDDSFDYNSVEGLMAAVNLNGPNEVLLEESSQSMDSGNPLEAEKATSGNDTNISECEGAEAKSELNVLIQESKTQSKKEAATERALVWNLENKTNDFEIDRDKEEEIKAMMSKITLPLTAIPPWAKELSEEEWKSQISLRIFGKNDNNLNR